MPVFIRFIRKITNLQKGIIAIIINIILIIITIIIIIIIKR